ncbi:hypothetical protein A2W54_04180 [Candidatus Giovannonibacteria bacterium RIFCSPHIGHO2_02_43_13]|uniref:Uncharacterized protein n=1 Tax=Candidatus Giovannonibacteria bacterium RIFCSPHIGHO2_02_43_13 TaxID=1798330 RepID=A0A1F5WSM4_9BACT|nr:MAG: hypothetical protein A3E06_02315 [Candidatus Giovannonibacteria bacterium RIFCSPHIGHO2_12_FULL_44_42]OGF78636.1 MAG: hypothetical protein A2W54_04180 [Candidatus Giovannonibacteria bacterium RIFCSPHIGHO2_02_43_13]
MGGVSHRWLGALCFPSGNFKNYKDMKIDTSAEGNRKSIISVITVIAIIVSINFFDLGLVGGAVVGAVFGGITYFVTKK